jgi:hypothetical protein
MILLPLFLEIRKAVICYGGWISSWRCGVAKEVNEKQLAKSYAIQNRVFFYRLFYGTLVQILQDVSCSPVLRS